MILESPSTVTSNFASSFRKDETFFSDSFRRLRQEAFDNFNFLGFPTTKNEEWKYTSVAPILKNNFTVAPPELRLTEAQVKEFLPSDRNAPWLLFENGRLNKSLSNVRFLEKGMIAGNIRDYANHPAVQKYLGRLAKIKNESFVSLNTFLFDEGAFIYFEKNSTSGFPLYLVFVNHSFAQPWISNPRNLIVASENAHGKIVESYHTISHGNASFCNSVSEIMLEESASVELTKLELAGESDFHIDSTNAVVARNAEFKIHTITTGGNITRNNLRIELKDNNASAYLNGLYLTTGVSHVDNHSLVDHASPDCYSNELYKGVLNDKSRAVFNGKIFVRRDAQKTNAYQSNKNILLSDDAVINAKPQLEIYADDVKCSHGATTGQLDEDALFYLRSRGIGEQEARAFLTTAFAGEIIDKISIPSLREKLKEIIHNKLRKGDE